MSLYNLTNGTTPDEVLIGTASSVPVFPIMLLVFTWFFVFIGGSKRQTDRFGYSDLPQWSLLASLSILLLGLMMTFSAGLISPATLGIIIGLNILTGAWFFLSRGRIE